jgi:tetratricopeptide (TPR) repeat protein
MLDLHLAKDAGDPEGEYRARKVIADLAPARVTLLRLGQAAAFTNRPVEAQKVLGDLVADEGWFQRNPSYWGSLVSAHFLTGDYEAALESIERAKSFGHQISLHRHEVAALVGLGRLGEATARAVQIAESNWSVGMMRVPGLLPQIFSALGHPEEARGVAEESLALSSWVDEAPAVAVVPALVFAGRYEEARRLLVHPEGLSNPGEKATAYRFLAYMAAMEGDAEEASRLVGLVESAYEAGWMYFADPYDHLSRAEVAASLGQKADAVIYLRQAFDAGCRFSAGLIFQWDWTPLFGYEPFEDLIRPKG